MCWRPFASRAAQGAEHGRHVMCIIYIILHYFRWHCVLLSNHINQFQMR